MNQDETSNSDSSEADTKPNQRSWRGIAEIDQAIHENRLTEYRWKKAWADPWTRRIGGIVVLLFAAFAIFVIYDEVQRF